MDFARVFRTVRHLTAEQWIYRAVCRGKFVAMEKLPAATARRFERQADAMPVLDPGAAELGAVSGHVRQLQRAVHGPWADQVPGGTFTLLNRTIDFGSIADVEWRRELGEKNNRLWRMNLAYMGYLVPLFERDSVAALPVAQALVTSMTEQNPWSSPGAFRDVWHPYTVSHRVINLLTCLRLLHEAGGDTGGAAAGTLTAEIRLGAAFILGNLERDLQYNHLLKNYVCLATVASAAPGWGFAAKALAGTRRSIEQQFLPDGGQAERAPMYHVLSLLDLRILHDSGAMNGPTLSLLETTIAGSEASLAGMVHPDGEVALFNDSWLGEGPPAATAVPGLPLRPADPLRIVLPETGYMRLARHGDSVIMDFGPCGPDDNPGHAHADFLSLELSVAGRRFLVDMGVPTYSEGGRRDMLRSAASHNGPICGKLEPIEFWGSFRVGHRGYAHMLPTTDAMEFAAWQDGYIAHGVAVARAIRLFPGRGLLICDQWIGAQPQDARTNYLVDGGWYNRGLRFEADDAAVVLQALEGTLGPVEAGVYWPRFSEGKSAHRFTMTPVSHGDSQRAILWLGWQGSTPDPGTGVALSDALFAAFSRVPEVERLIDARNV